MSGRGMSGGICPRAMSYTFDPRGEVLTLTDPCGLPSGMILCRGNFRGCIWGDLCPHTVVLNRKVP